MSSLSKFIDRLNDTFPEDRLTYQKGLATFHPENISEAAKMIGLANQERQQLFITGFGNQLDPLGSAFERLIVMRTDRLGQLLEVNESGLSIVVGAGFPLREINAKIESAGLFLPIGELSYVGSVGGSVAVGLSAQLPAKHWQSKPNQSEEKTVVPQISIERYLLRLDVATAGGETKTFGVATDKQPHGENFAKIFSPSWGLFGFIASAKLRVAPLSAKPEYEDLCAMEISFQTFLAEHMQADANSDTNGISAHQRYFQRLKKQLDPDNIFPVVKVS